MTTRPILKVAVAREADIVVVRQRARRIADLLGFDGLEQTRLATAASEIARTLFFMTRSGEVEFLLDDAVSSQVFVARIRAIDAETAWDEADPHLVAARRLMGRFVVADGSESDRVVSLGRMLSARQPHVTPARLAAIADTLNREGAGDLHAELLQQNVELLRSLELLQVRRDETERLNEELERTNKGVVALYAEIDRRSSELQELNATLEQRIATAIAERERVEESLRQSQKMEAVGQLTGGIAHDFNNLLMIIGGSLEMLRRRVPSAPAVDRLFDAARQGVERGARLNQQLLAFSRRQDLAVEVFCPADIVPAFRDLLERAVSEAIDIRVDIAPDTGFCRTDRHQLETAILNLAINARDAMPTGGRLELSTGNRTVDEKLAELEGAKAGEYVAVALTDTGVGMSPAVIARVFEPFFTTKEVGKGTGLGLSQVYGFARQSGGFVVIDSVEGQGTTVTVHLPRTEAGDVVPTAVVTPSRVHGQAAILVVEDDAAVRSTTSAMLRDLGYTVLEADSGHNALAALDKGRFDLVFSDVIMPGGMSGFDLARKIRASTPEMPILLTSGYTGEAFDAGHDDAPPLLRKPYGEAELSAAVRAALHAD